MVRHPFCLLLLPPLVVLGDNSRLTDSDIMPRENFCWKVICALEWFDPKRVLDASMGRSCLCRRCVHTRAHSCRLGMRSLRTDSHTRSPTLEHYPKMEFDDILFRDLRSTLFFYMCWYLPLTLIYISVLASWLTLILSYYVKMYVNEMYFKPIYIHSQKSLQIGWKHQWTIRRGHRVV